MQSYTYIHVYMYSYHVMLQHWSNHSGADTVILCVGGGGGKCIHMLGMAN